MESNGQQITERKYRNNGNGYGLSNSNGSVMKAMAIYENESVSICRRLSASCNNNQYQ
jgi:hypothetical protein